jgi:hypothetical protein
MRALGSALGRLIEVIRDWRNAKAEWRHQKDLAAHYAEEARRRAEPDHASARLAAEWDRQQNYQPSAEEARDLAERQRNVIRWPK